MASGNGKSVVDMPFHDSGHWIKTGTYIFYRRLIVHSYRALLEFSNNRIENVEMAAILKLRYTWYLLIVTEERNTFLMNIFALYFIASPSGF